MFRTPSPNLMLLGVLMGAVLAACGGGSGSAGAPAVPTVGPSGNAPDHVSLVIKIPQPPAGSSARRHANYVSSATQSLGVVVTNAGYTPSPAVYVNLSQCQSVGGVYACTVSVAAMPGDDEFTITAYSGLNGSGSALSTGSTMQTIASSGPIATVTLTLGGVVAKIVVTAPQGATVPLGQYRWLDVSAQDASGATIVGAYDNPILLTGSNLYFYPGTASVAAQPSPGTSVSLPDSSSSAQTFASWVAGFAPAAAAAQTVTATADGQTATLSLIPGTGFAYYDTTSAAPAGGEEVAQAADVGPDGNVYFTSFTISASTGAINGGVIHAFDPTTFTGSSQATAVPLEQLFFDSSGALWYSDTETPTIYRVGSPSASGLGSASIQAIPLPSPTNGAQGATNVFGFAQDDAQHLWFADAYGDELLSLPIAGPYAATAMSAYAMTVPSFGVAYGSDGNLYVAQSGEIAQVNPATGVMTAQVEVPQQTSLVSQYGSNVGANALFMTSNGTSMFTSSWGSCTYGCTQTLSNGFIDTVTPGGPASPPTLAALTLPASDEQFSIEATYASSTMLYFFNNFYSAEGYVNLSTGQSREIPMNISDVASGPPVQTPDGSMWFAGFSTGGADSFMMAKAVYLGGWSIFPNTLTQLGGSAQGIGEEFGIMEAPTANSGPFAVTPVAGSACTVSYNGDHNFEVFPNGSSGPCTITVTDTHGTSQTITSSSVAVTGTIQSRRRPLLLVPSKGVRR